MKKLVKVKNYAILRRDMDLEEFRENIEYRITDPVLYSTKKEAIEQGVENYGSKKNFDIVYLNTYIEIERKR